MSSTNTINFSLRQNKAIERHIVFDALQQGSQFLGNNPVYVGLGSVWFQDFQLAYRNLKCSTLVSIEHDDGIFKRAEFNRPFKNIDIRHGWTHEIIPELLEEEPLANRSWIVWLDYDAPMTNSRIEELENLVTNLPASSALLTTFNANPKRYAEDPEDRERALERLFGKHIAPSSGERVALKNPDFMQLVAKYTLDRLRSHSLASGSDIRFVPAMRLLYRDSENMVTIGGFLPKKAQLADCESLVDGVDWCGVEDELIHSQPLTLREIQALNRLLPMEGPLTAEAMEELGFVLDEPQLKLFQRHNLRYPIYAELT